MNQCSQHRWLLDTDQCSQPEFPQGTMEELVQEWEQVLVRDPDHPGSSPHMMQCTLQTYQPSIDQCICPEYLQGMAGALVLVTELVMALVLVLVLYIQYRTNPHKPCTRPKSSQDIAQCTCSECHRDKDPQERALVLDLAVASASVWVVSVLVHLDNLPDKMKCTLRNFLLGTEQCKWPKIHQDKVEAMVVAWVEAWALASALASAHLDNLLDKMRCTLQMHPQGTAQHMRPDFHQDTVVELVQVLVQGLELVSENRHTPVHIC